MSLRVRVAGSTACLLAFCALAQAAEPLAWPQAVELAGRGHPDLRAAQENLRAAEYQASGAWAGFLPQVNGSVSYTDSRAAGVDQTQYTTAVTASQNLFAGFRDRGTVAQGAANRDAAAGNVDAVRARASYELKSAYAQLRYARENQRLAADIVRRREENLRLVQLRYEGGRENKGSYFLSKAALAQARLERLQADQAIEVAREQLARVLGLPVAEWEAIDVVPVAPPPAESALDEWLRQTPEYRQSLAQEQSAAASVEVARAGLLPSLNVSGSVGRAGESWAPQDDTRSVGATLSVPFYSGGRDYYATRAAAASFAAAQANRDGVERQTRSRLRQAHSNYVQSVEKLNVDDEFVQAATARAEIARSKYNNGLQSFEDWDIIENDLISRQKAQLVSARERVIAEAAFEQARGLGVIP